MAEFHGILLSFSDVSIANRGVGGMDGGSGWEVAKTPATGAVINPSQWSMHATLVGHGGSGSNAISFTTQLMSELGLAKCAPGKQTV